MAAWNGCLFTRLCSRSVVSRVERAENADLEKIYVSDIKIACATYIDAYVGMIEQALDDICDLHQSMQEGSYEFARATRRSSELSITTTMRSCRSSSCSSLSMKPV